MDPILRSDPSNPVGRNRLSTSSAAPRQARYDGCAMNIVEKVFAAVMVAVCCCAAARHAARPRRRARVDASIRRGSERWQRRLARFIAWPGAELRARRETREAIRRARRSASERDGNVHRPKVFKGKGKRRDLH
jgi:hypothetical protein